jgi:peptide/nickel transport system permease protein
MAYVARRLLQSLLILVGISLVTFVLLYLVPADPARQIAGRSATAQTVENIREQLGLNLPFYQQYLRYLGDLLQGVRYWAGGCTTQSIVMRSIAPMIAAKASGSR